MSPRRLAMLLAAASCALPACSGAFGPAAPPGVTSKLDAGQASDASGIDNSDGGLIKDAGASRDAAADAFFINDPAPPICDEDGGMYPAPPVMGSAECPADKNRQGCPCPAVGTKAACWPGKRQNREHGICKDGMTTCRGTDEFAPAWGPCEGYVLPVDGAVQGPEACRCFSSGQWTLSNLVPCISTTDSGTWLYSSRVDALAYVCDPVAELPPPVPPADWSMGRLTIDCAGRFRLCYTIKAGSATDPKPDDCAVMQSCIDVWYERAGESQTLPNLPGWAARDASCSKRFVESGGYGEMSVLGRSEECDPVDDGHGKPYVFNRTSYCPVSCGDTPDTEGCKACSMSGSGSF